MIAINIFRIAGSIIALYAANTMWGSVGMWFTLGLLLQDSTLNITFKRRSK